MNDTAINYKKTSRISFRKLGRTVLRGYGGIVAGDLRTLPAAPVDLDLVMTTSRAWLLQNIDRTDGAVAEHFHLLQGWGKPYPEITGYTITTLLEMQQQNDDQTAAAYACRMADWLLNRQLASGAWNSHQGGSAPSVFNTGQILDGLSSFYSKVRTDPLRRAGARAARFLVNACDDDGVWRSGAMGGIAHTYYARAAWALAKWSRLVHDELAFEAAETILNWTAEQANDAGWFESASFSEREHEWPFTHTTAYVIEGLIEGGACLFRPDLIEVGAKAARALAERLDDDGRLGGAFDRDWTPAQWECLTGTAQMARCWGRLAELTGESSWVEPAERAVHRVARTIRPRDLRPEIRGAIKGSHPHWGPYGPFAYPSHAVKFFLDAMLVVNRLAERRSVGKTPVQEDLQKSP